MKKLSYKVGIATFLFSVLIMPLRAQEEETPEMNKAMFHMSFITPFGTNGLQSWNTINHFSINLFAGFSGGLEGLELGGFANGLRGDMDGIQLAGFCNNTFGQAHGLEIAGFYNYNHGYVKGMQIAGFANAALSDVEGAQISGFANHAQGSAMGQVAGFANSSLGEKSGMQIAGFANFSRGSGVGGQLAGFANATTGDLKGIQIAGFINYAHRITGVQLAPFNVADTLDEGIAIGFWSWIRNGYQVIQLGSNETLLGEISLKSGVKKFYNIFSLGSSIRNNQIKWGWGYGIGSLWELSPKFDVGMEAITYHLNEDRWWSNNLNLLNRLNLLVSYNVMQKMSVYAGPAWNVWVSHSRAGLETMEPISGDWYWFDRSTSRNRVAMYPGLQAGLRIGI